MVVAGTVFCAASQGDGKVLIGGDFLLEGAGARTRVARLNADGSLDGSFNPGTGADATVYGLALQLDGKVVIGGDFIYVNGTNRTRVARLHTDGSLDLNFTAGSGPNNVVYAVGLLPDGHVIIGGSFTMVGGYPRGGIARLNGDIPPDLILTALLVGPQLQLSIPTLAGRTYAVDASSDFVTWTPLATNTVFSATWSFTDTNASMFNRRFYRVRQLSP